MNLVDRVPKGLAIVATAVLFASGCSSPSDDGDSPKGGGVGSKNLIVNGDFEQGRESWFVPPDSPEWASFEVSSGAGVDGTDAAELRLRAQAAGTGTRIWGLAQDITTSELPRQISGQYRVADWKRATKDQYVQFVVILFGSFEGEPNIQIRYVLSGTRSPPFSIGNAKFRFLGPEEPQVGRWIRFERDLRDDFVAAWGEQAEALTGMRVFFEARYDDKKTGQTGSADVFFDKLSMG